MVVPFAPLCTSVIFLSASISLYVSSIKSMSNFDSSLNVKSLVCHAHVDMAIACLGSLQKFSLESVSFTIHDDGSLIKEDIDKLSNALNVKKIVLRPEADKIMSDLLRSYPNCRKYRAINPLSLKYLDMPLLSHQDLAYCDTDILFFKPFTNLFKWPDPKVSAMFMLDYREAYSIPPWILLFNDCLKLPSKVNSGLMFMRKEFHDLDFIEWFLGDSNKKLRSIPGWTGQTCCAALAGHSNCAIYHPEQVVLIRSNKNISNSTVAGHFVSNSRDLLKQYLSQGNFDYTQYDTPISIKTIVPKPCNLIDLARSQLRHNAGLIKYSILEAFKN